MAMTTDVTLDPDKLYEIVHGHFEAKEMPGARHGGICGRLAVELGTFLKAHGLGALYLETNFRLGENERIPDLAFVSAGRIPPEGEPATPWQLPPDVAVEVISPHDLYERVYAKAMEYLAAGVHQVWLVSPEHQMVTVYRSATDITAFTGESILVSEDVLPGFRCPLREIFTSPGFTRP